MSCYKQSSSSIAALLVLLVTSLPGRAMELPDFTALVERVAPAVVNISTKQNGDGGGRLPKGLDVPGLPDELHDFFRRFFERQQSEDFDARSLGSGFIISADGYILTNHHVVDEADEILVRLSDRREMMAEVIGSDKRSDTALIKIEAKGLPVVKIGRSEDLKVGQWVMAIGSPFGFDHSATVGIISALGRNLPSENYVPFIQTDVAINPGNSGGPLFNLKGEVIGVNSQIYSRTGGYMGLSFAIPIDVAMNSVRQLREHGRVSRGYLGVLIQDVNRGLAESFGMRRPEGALVARIMADSPAERAGVQIGDIIVEFNGEKVVSSAMLPPIVGRTPVGTSVRVKVLRDGKTKTLTVRLGELPEDEAAATQRPAQPEAPNTHTSERLGLQVTNLTEARRERMDAPDYGVLVAEVARGGPADKAGIQPGDLLLMLNRVKIRDVAELARQADELPEGQYVPILVQRDGGAIFVPLRIPES
jgi:serine protease Do